jgi:hypothetical protein
MKNAWSYTCSAQQILRLGALLSTGYVFMAWYLVKHRDNFTKQLLNLPFFSTKGMLQVAPSLPELHSSGVVLHVSCTKGWSLFSSFPFSDKNSYSVKSGTAWLFHQRLSECTQKFPDWPPGARTANGAALCR